MRYLIFGGSGYLGSHLVEKLLAENHEIVVFDNLSGNVVSHLTNSFSLVLGDITKMEDFQDLNLFENFDGVFHLAAKKSVSESLANPEMYLDVNENGTFNVVTYCIRNGVKNLVFTSSAAVYGELSDPNPIDENSRVVPLNPYGLTKLNAESLLTSHSLKNDFKAISLRIFNIVGASRLEYFDSAGENVLPTIARALNQNETFIIFGDSYKTEDGTCVRDYVNVSDVAIAHILAMKYLQKGELENSHQIVNISSGIGISLLELISKMSQTSGKNLNFKYGEARSGDPASVVGNNKLAKRLLGWNPSIGIDQSIRETLGQF